MQGASRFDRSLSGGVLVSYGGFNNVKAPHREIGRLLMLVPSSNVLRNRLTRGWGKRQTLDPERSNICNLTNSLVLAPYARCTVLFPRLLLPH